MKVLLASTSAEMFSGAVRCLLELAIQLRKRQIEVVVVVPRHGDMEDALKKEGIPYYCIHEYHSWYTSPEHRNNHFYGKRLLNGKALIQMLYVIRKEKVDLVHVNSLTAYVAGWAASFSRKPLVWHIREFMEEDLGISFFDPPYSVKKLNRADRMIAISESVKQKWETVLSSPMEVIYDGIPVEDYYISREEKIAQNTKMDLIPNGDRIRNGFSESHRPIRVLLYGRIVPGKGQLFFLQGVHRALKQTSRSLVCCWAGRIEDPAYYEACCRYLADNHLSDQIVYLGEVRNIKETLAQTDIVCVCSHREGFGRVTVEAMLGQCLVLGADSGGTRELIQDGVTGFLYKEASLQSFAKQLTGMAEHYEEYEAIAINGQQYAMEHFTVEKNADQIAALYRQLEQEIGAKGYT